MTRCNCPQCQPVTGDCPAATDTGAEGVVANYATTAAEVIAVTAERDAAKQLAYDESDLRGQMEKRCVALIDERDAALAALALLHATPAPGAAAGAVQIGEA